MSITTNARAITTSKRAIAALSIAAAMVGMNSQFAPHAHAAEATATDNTATFLQALGNGNQYILQDKAMNEAVAPLILQLRGDDSGQEIYAYCIEVDTPILDSIAGVRGAYSAQDWETYTSQAKTAERRASWSANKHKVLWLLANSYPQKPAREVFASLGMELPTYADGSTYSEKDLNRAMRDATQLAIWHFANGIDLSDNWIDEANHTRIGRFADGSQIDIYEAYQRLIERAEKAPVVENVTPSIFFQNANSTNVAGNVFKPLTLKSTAPANVNVSLPEGATLTVSGKEYTGDVKLTAVTDGTTMQLAVPSSAAAGSVEISADAQGQPSPVGTVWYAKGSQSLITAKAVTQHVMAKTTINWTAKPAAPAPVEPTTPAPTSPVTPAPVVPTTPAPVQPTTPAPAPVVPTTPAAPAPVEPTAPTTPAPSTPAPAAPRKEKNRAEQPKKVRKAATPMVTRTFQVDRYMPQNAVQARGVAALDNDGVLKYREDKFMWGRSAWQIVTVTVPANASHADIMKAINAKTSAKIGDVNIASKLASSAAGRTHVIAWELGKGATAKNAWGTAKKTVQKFFARG
ncbi:Cys-Gln thioester bond-forming surface protein [Dermatophilus congolensis]|uniref:Cys-Gln thioester bond-forming surface protein n=1 Tax=Dermatophilus congolensis TaxID=1863 RepID=UPI001AAE327B|nr:Cys-Gln thioester bond-forming surface protein [Dermatophilus congolensis]MBO3130067.1 Cys-Gln thioester bond-forming surface protein [Dermatophilus congolensis]MBO3131306.1 Cys-Gln thioester bond-forming surface protein [Dermatophilus congolensis]MBO3134538.1 Cys-Gln thioester bond-forming surface protein [Dermatophilus congolensis]MBO3136775.1 Cys-Gln thioester bond-forming surface protein [Dermatophilus congolensis]MBO3139019.1 Cys-Gln thioester bond-forming surface protein [Dermatophilu